MQVNSWNSNTQVNRTLAPQFTPAAANYVSQLQAEFPGIDCSETLILPPGGMMAYLCAEMLLGILEEMMGCPDCCPSPFPMMATPFLGAPAGCNNFPFYGYPSGLWNNVTGSQVGPMNPILSDGKGFSFTAKMAIDSDGVGSSHGDVYHQNQTSMRLANGSSLNADVTPYLVLPPQVAKRFGAKPGDLAIVTYKGKSSPAIFGDVGPRAKLGEGSMKLAANLGINNDPNRGGASGGVKYQVFPGSGRRVQWTHANTTTAGLMQELRRQNLA